MFWPLPDPPLQSPLPHPPLSPPSFFPAFHRALLILRMTNGEMAFGKSVIGRNRVNTLSKLTNWLKLIAWLLLHSVNAWDYRLSRYYKLFHMTLCQNLKTLANLFSSLWKRKVCCFCMTPLFLFCGKRAVKLAIQLCLGRVFQSYKKAIYQIENTFFMLN